MQTNRIDVWTGNIDHFLKAEIFHTQRIFMGKRL